MGIYMTDKEIRFLWRNRGMNESKTIQCIADLNGCHYGEARDKCEQIGLIPEGAFRKNKSRSNNDLWTADDLSKSSYGGTYKACMFVDRAVYPDQLPNAGSVK